MQNLKPELHKKSTLYLNYGGIHDVAIRSLSSEFDIIEIGIGIQKALSICLDDHKPSSMAGSIYYYRELVKFINKKNLYFDYIAIADLTHPLNNLLFSNFCMKSIVLTYDGSINILNSKMTLKNILKDVLKKCYCFLHDLSYTVRYKNENGINLIKKRQVYELKDLDYSPITYDQSTASYIKSLKNVIIYVSIALDYFSETKYREHEKRSIDFLEKKYKRPVKIIYRNNIPDKYINKEKRIDREYFKGQSAEEIIFLINPKLIAGDVSSVLLNCAKAQADLKIISIGLDNYCKNLERRDPNPFIEAFNKKNIHVFNLD